MKEFIEFIKKIWANKKTRSLAILILYFIFFIFVFAFIGNYSPKTAIINEPKELIDMEISKIEFIGENNFAVIGDSIIYNESTYSVNEMPTEIVGYDISIYTAENIDKLIKSSVLETTNYVDKTDTYLISVKDFENIVYNNSVESDLNIRIKQSQDMNYIYIDFKECYGYEVKIDLRS